MIKHKMTVATLALSLFLIGTTTVLVSCGNDDTKTTVTEPANAIQMKQFAEATLELSKPENLKNASLSTKVAVEKTTSLLINQSKDLLFANGTSEKELTSMSSSKIIEKAFAVYAEECQKQQTLKN